MTSLIHGKEIIPVVNSILDLVWIWIAYKIQSNFAVLTKGTLSQIQRDDWQDKSKSGMEKHSDNAPPTSTDGWLTGCV